MGRLRATTRLEALLKKLFAYCAFLVMGTMVLTANASARDNEGDHARHVREMRERHEAHERLVAREHQREAWKHREEKRRAERREWAAHHHQAVHHDAVHHDHDMGHHDYRKQQGQ